MKEKIRIVKIFILFAFVSILFSLISSAIIMQPKWKKRRLLGIQNARSRIGHEEVIGKENITINGVNYTALIVKITPVDAPPEEENDSWIINYYNSSDLSLIKIVRPGNYTSLFQPPLKEFDYPIQIGKEWRQEVEEIMCLPYGYKERWNLTFHYNCTEKTTIKVPAGTFSCYVMKRDGKSNENSYTLYYISSKVGREVKTVSYINGKILSEKILLSFSYRRGNEEGDLIPDFEFPFLWGTMIIVILLRKLSKH